ncbi:MAG: antitoxin VapB family protein [Candidatus Thermoplasmatota archaeon]|nr:antitoxin VapB family protein [Candidatus Thermoplasmatota archaeon]
MGSKTISIKDSTYEKLLALKGEDESFSDLIEELTKEETPRYADFAGVLSQDTIDSIKKIREKREESGRIEDTIEKLKS